MLHRSPAAEPREGPHRRLPHLGAGVLQQVRDPHDGFGHPGRAADPGGGRPGAGIGAGERVDEIVIELRAPEQLVGHEVPQEANPGAVEGGA